jgi:hypothetical protein
MDIHKTTLTNGTNLYTSGDMTVEYSPKSFDGLLYICQGDDNQITLTPEEVESLKEILNIL